MPSNRRLKTIAIVAVLIVLALVYVTTGEISTKESPFYTRTVAAIKTKEDAAERKAAIEEERARLDRVAKLEEEHKIAMAAQAAQADKKNSPMTLVTGESRLPPAVAAEPGAGAQKPIADALPPPVQQQQPAQSTPTAKPIPVESEKSVAGRKMMKDGKKVSYDKASGVDGVAKVGNVDTKDSAEDQGHDEQAQKAEEALNGILKKSPIIIFSKSYCPYSKKAKHILLDLYKVNPTPFVVELDQHNLGPGIQSALAKMTGRSTVPNVLVTGKSIGGGDDVAQLHKDGNLIETLTSVGGRRISAQPNPEVEDATIQMHALKFRS